MQLSAFLISVLVLCDTSDGFHRMYETFQSISGTTGYAFHCFYNLRIISLSFNTEEFTPAGSVERLHFCRRIAARKSDEIFHFNTKVINGKELTFDSLREWGISARQLFDWYAPMDTIEEYILGENQGVFYNCSRRMGNYWFGPKCQYTFDSTKDFINIMENQFYEKRVNSDHVLSVTNGTCYPISDEECQSIICLDWREICDGKIDCISGFDEHRCRELEMNECNQTTEYRCLNGQCIDKVFYLNEVYDCMDRSDETLAIGNDEDRLCPPLWFSCGDGDCYDGPNVDHEKGCHSKRDRLYLQQMPPSMLILFTHVFLISNDTQPEYICYNQTLCPYLTDSKPVLSKTFLLNDSTCRAFNTFTNRTYSNSYDMIKDFKSFVYACSIPPQFESLDNCSLFQCDGNTKCLSFHRLSDGHKDCSNGYDEQQNDTCSRNLPYRYTCDMGTRCIHRLLIADDIVHCNDKSDEYDKFASKCCCGDEYKPENIQCEARRFNMTFSQICNGLLEYAPDAFNNTDESNCLMNEWRCLTQYSKCDGIWNCPDGRDELGCGSNILGDRQCGNSSHFCLNITTGLSICLSPSRAGDGTIDCVGSTDERAFCRAAYPNNPMRRYRCRNSDQCIAPFQVCDCYQDCPENDDETTACVWLNNGQDPFCHELHFRCRDGKVLNCNDSPCRCNTKFGSCKENEQTLFCGLIDHVMAPTFALDNMEEYSHVRKNQVSRSLRTLNNYPLWHCNRGVVVRSTENSFGFECFCSVYYYGNRCEYQRKRIGVNLQFQMRSSFDRFFLSILKIVVLLIRENSSSMIILSHDQFLYVPQRDCFQTHLIELLYPINESHSSSFNDSVHIYAFVAQNLTYYSSWNFLVPFNFLPVNRIAKQLIINETASGMDPLMVKILKNNCTLCSNNGLCLGYNVDLGRDICICPLNYTGRRCVILFDPCTKDSCNGHGQCVSIDERYDVEGQFICLCDNGWIGEWCESFSPRIHVSFAADISIPPSNIALVHLLYISRGPIHLFKFYRLQQLMSNLTIFLDLESYMPNLVFIQLYKNRDHFDYYLLHASDHRYHKPLSEMYRQVHSSRRCRSLEELFNATVVAQPRFHRVKKYQQACLNQLSGEKLRCFYDDELMCLCDETNYTNCLHFNSRSFGCPWNKCSDRGVCVQDHELCPIRSLCICEPCTYGSICQFSTAGYSLSLDAILGSHIQMKKNILDQTHIIQTSVIIFSILVIIGILLDILAIGTFAQKTTHDVGCGLYLFVSSCLGLLTMILLICKMILLIHVEEESVSCALVEFLLKWCPTSSEWLNACVAIDRSLAVVRQTSYSCSASQRRAKWIVLSIFLLIGLLCSPELIYRRKEIDTQSDRSWCVFTLNADRRVLHTLYSISNVCLFVIPLSINLMTPVIIILGILHYKQKSSAVPNIKPKKVNENDTTDENAKRKQKIPQKNRFNGIKEQIEKYKLLLIGPVVLGILSLPRLVFAFIFVCTKLDQKPFASLFGYLIGFLPSMAIFFAYVLPSKTYQAAFYSFIKQILPQSIGNWIDARRHRV